MRRCILGLTVLLVLMGTLSAKAAIVHYVFITADITAIDVNETYPPNLPSWGGYAGADYMVTSALHWQSLGPWGTMPGFSWDPSTIDDLLKEDFVRAILSSPSVDARDRFPISGSIYNAMGDRIAVSSEDLWDGNLENGVSYDEYGSLVPNGTPIWTGTQYDGTFANQSAGEWNQVSGSADVSTSPSATGSAWMFSDAINAGAGARLYGITRPYDTVTGEYLEWGYEAPAVPEPSTLVMWSGLAMMGLIAARRRRRTT